MSRRCLCDFSSIGRCVLAVTCAFFFLRNVFDRVPGEHRDWITSRTPHKDATLEQKQAANESIVKYIENDAEQIISEDARCYCHIHNLFCEAIPANVTSKRKREESTGSTDDEND